jgi:hypothetical protein
MDYVYENAFQIADHNYSSPSYFIAGAIDGNQRLHDALRYLLATGITRLKYGAGKIGIVPIDLPTSASAEFFPGDIRLRSMSIEQTTLDSMINDIVVMYDKQGITDQHEGSFRETRADSINRYGLHRKRMDFSMVRDEAIAQLIAERLLDKYAKPPAILTFTAYMGALPLEKQDWVLFESGFLNYEKGRGRVATVTRRFAKPKNRAIHLATIRLFEPESFLLQPFFIDRAEIFERLFIERGREMNIRNWFQVTDSISVLASEIIEQVITDTITVSDPIVVELIEGGYGIAGYGITGYGV